MTRRRLLHFANCWQPNRPWAFVCGALAAIVLLLAPAARAVLVESGAPNNTAPAEPIDNPGFANIGLSSTGGASVTYLGNRWILTVNHATIGNNFGPIRFGSFSTNVVENSKVQLKNFDNSLADLALWRLVDDPGLPALDIASTPVALGTAVTMIGNGRTIGNALSDGTGYQVDVSTFTIRWGTNDVSLTNQFETVGFGANRSFHTRFDNMGPAANESQVARGDSGGGVFRRPNDLWELTGIIFANLTNSNQPNTGPPNFEPTTVVFGNESVIADLSFYRNQIVSLVGTRVPGDLNGNSTVDFADLNTLLSHFSGPGSLGDGDFDGNGFVDFADLNVILANYGTGSVAPPQTVQGEHGVLSAAVPEPASVALAAAASLALLLYVLRRRMIVRS